jgi:pilus assembly protein Flp/PilA
LVEAAAAGIRIEFKHRFVWSEKGASMLKDLIKRFGDDEEGAAAIEYALIAALIAIAIIAGATILGGGMNKMFTDLGNYVSGLAGSLP